MNMRTLPLSLALEVTLRPAITRFAEIARIYLDESGAIPYSVEDGWDKFERIRDWAAYEFRTGLWV